MVTVGWFEHETESDPDEVPRPTVALVPRVNHAHPTASEVYAAFRDLQKKPCSRDEELACLADLIAKHAKVSPVADTVPPAPAAPPTPEHGYVASILTEVTDALYGSFPGLAVTITHETCGSENLAYTHVALADGHTLRVAADTWRTALLDAARRHSAAQGAK